MKGRSLLGIGLFVSCLSRWLVLQKPSGSAEESNILFSFSSAFFAALDSAFELLFFLEEEVAPRRERFFLVGSSLSELTHAGARQTRDWASRNVRN